MGTNPPTCLTCRSGDPEKDAVAWKVEASCISESHFEVCLMRCPACGARALYVFAELIDWSNSDDSQASLLVPLPASEAVDRSVLDEEDKVDALLARLPVGEYLARICPRGMTDKPAWVWRRGTPFILPHD